MQAGNPAPRRPRDASEPVLAALINPRSFRMSLRRRASRTAERVADHGGEVHQVADLAAIERALQNAMARNVARLVIAGGDGTLQGSVSWLARNLKPERLPELIVLSAGRTNYVAGDIGSRRRFPDTLEKILTSGADRLHPVDRATLELEHPSLARQHGFFMAGASIDEIIRYVHRWQAAKANWWRNAHAASTLGVFSLATRRIVRRYRFDPPRLRVRARPLGGLDGRCRFLLATTLTHAGSPIDPYARSGRGPLRLTAVDEAAAGLRWRLPRLVTGHFSPAMNRENGYLSGLCEDIEIVGLKQITLDGQEFDLDPSEPLRIRPGPVFRFLRP